MKNFYVIQHVDVKSSFSNSILKWRNIDPRYANIFALSIRTLLFYYRLSASQTRIKENYALYPCSSEILFSSASEFKISYSILSCWLKYRILGNVCVVSFRKYHFVTCIVFKIKVKEISRFQEHFTSRGTRTNAIHTNCILYCAIFLFILKLAISFTSPCLTRTHKYANFL